MEHDLLASLQGKLPHDVWVRIVDRVKELQLDCDQAELNARAARDNLLHLRANCAAEEQMRVSLLTKIGPLEHEKSKLKKELVKTEKEVAAAKEAKRDINAEIERLNEDLFSEANKLVKQEVREKNELKVREAVIRDEFETLMSMMLLQRERCSVLGIMMKELPMSGAGLFSLDLEQHQEADEEEEQEQKNFRKSSF